VFIWRRIMQMFCGSPPYLDSLGALAPRRGCSFGQEQEEAPTAAALLINTANIAQFLL
jgi:hypothetical protein